MARKAGWMLVLLAVLLVISASAAWAAGVNRPTQSSLLPSGNAAVTKLDGKGDMRYAMPRLKKSSGHFCNGDSAGAVGDSAGAAY